MAELTFQRQVKGALPFRDADRVIWRDFLDHLRPGTCFKARLTLPRYLIDHKRFFGIVNKAFENNRSNIAFADPEHLRAWLLCEAGHCATFDVPANGASVMGIDGYADFMCRLMYQAAARGHAFADADEARRAITVKMPHSVSWARLDQRAFAPVRDACYELIETRIVPGVKVTDLFTAALEDPQ
jgi:hypothetical protein